MKKSKRVSSGILTTKITIHGSLVHCFEFNMCGRLLVVCCFLCFVAGLPTQLGHNHDDVTKAQPLETARWARMRYRFRLSVRA